MIIYLILICTFCFCTRLFILHVWIMYVKISNTHWYANDVFSWFCIVLEVETKELKLFNDLLITYNVNIIYCLVMWHSQTKLQMLLTGQQINYKVLTNFKLIEDKLLYQKMDFDAPQKLVTEKIGLQTQIICVCHITKPQGSPFIISIKN